MSSFRTRLTLDELNSRITPSVTYISPPDAASAVTVEFAGEETEADAKLKELLDKLDKELDGLYADLAATNLIIGGAKVALANCQAMLDADKARLEELKRNGAPQADIDAAQARVNVSHAFVDATNGILDAAQKRADKLKEQIEAKKKERDGIIDEIRRLNQGLADAINVNPGAGITVAVVTSNVAA